MSTVQLYKLEGISEQLAFILAGDAYFTLLNEATGHRNTYHIVKKEPEKGSKYTRTIWFVSYLAGANNQTDYVSFCNIGFYENGYLMKMNKTAPAGLHNSAVTKGISWLITVLQNGTGVNYPMSLYHMGRCGKCGRPLTTPESIQIGLGPICVTK